ncbi:hypothetical protein K493DRAFT_382360 [Basidiobolus meristosporus CBS 931.73]|uniref:RRM domain-containing protein n=1 Tax=Basidiobolus meristosporus CBS 931.73 TaxID=1314790 RepID=A0A1Y1XW04_9FUNG|nr:hypothetical protein K493DRAFT_382360 [Basidiobolus meristosporus CBS 931.73]|eukprot:ORX89656.1 hypothetical protein K493DRAFT_382360 [Basidiobolus meristosporus CBS 931.73]
MIRNEEITTIFVIGFPEDMQEREFQNMFLFSPGFEAATLKASPVNDADEGLRKQAIGFAKFRSRLEALQARDILSGKKVDPERGCLLKAEMAKKNLLTKRGLSAEGAFMNSNINLVQALTPNGTTAFGKKQYPGHSTLNTMYDGLFSAGPILPSGLLVSPQPPIHEFGMDYETLSLASSSPPEDGSLEMSMLDCGLSDANMVRVPGYYPKRSMTAPTSFEGIESSFSFPKFSVSTSLNKSSTLFGANANRSSTSDLLPFPTSKAADTVTACFLPSTTSSTVRVNTGDQNPPCNTLYVGNLPMSTKEEELYQVFSVQPGYKRLCFRVKPHNGPMCFVEFDDIQMASHTLHELQGHLLSSSVKGGIRLSYSKNPLGVRNPVPIH